MALIFVETKRTADLLQVQIERRGYTIGVLHGDLSQKERDDAMRRFVATHVRSLIATNVAARGLDIDDISHVINYDVPGTPDDYLHRVGRTGRAGRSGVAITLITPAEILKLRDVERTPARTSRRRRSTWTSPPTHLQQRLSDEGGRQSLVPRARAGHERSSSAAARARPPRHRLRRPPPPPRVSPRRLPVGPPGGSPLRGVRCLRPDMWGCGSSPELPDPLLATLDGYAAAVLRSLDAAGVGEFVAVGSSMGGYTALALLRQDPERLSALVLVSSRATADTPEQAKNRRKMAGLALRDGVETVLPMVKRLLGPGRAPSRHIADPVVDGFAAAVRRGSRLPGGDGGPARQHAAARLGGCAGLVIQATRTRS